MSPWHLLWIVPLSMGAGVILIILAMARRDHRDQ